MYEQVFNFSSRPFTTTPFVKHYFPGTSIQQSLGQAQLCVDRASGPVILIGDIGTGKSLFLAMLEEHYKTEFNVVNLACARLESRKDLLQNVLFAMDRPVVGLTESELRFDLMSQVKPNPKCPNGLLLLVDDAEALSTELIDELRLITNYVVDGHPRVRLVMAGRFALEENLNDPKVASFGQRVACRCYLQALSKDETGAYVKEHINRAGGNADQLFGPDALERIYEASEGIPRLINQVGDFSLIIAGTRGVDTVSAEIVAEAWADVQNIPGVVHEAAHDPTPPENEWTVIEFGQLEDAEEGTVYEFGAEPSAVESPASETVESETVESETIETEPVDTEPAEVSSATEAPTGTSYIIPDEPEDQAYSMESASAGVDSIVASTEDETVSSASWEPDADTEERVFSPFQSAPQVEETTPATTESLTSESSLPETPIAGSGSAEETPQVDASIGIDLAALERMQRLAESTTGEPDATSESTNESTDAPAQDADLGIEDAASTLKEIQEATQQQSELASQFASVFGTAPTFENEDSTPTTSEVESLGNSETTSEKTEADSPAENTGSLPPLDLTSFVRPPASEPTEGIVNETDELVSYDDTWPVVEKTPGESESVSAEATSGAETTSGPVEAVPPISIPAAETEFHSGEESQTETIEETENAEPIAAVEEPASQVESGTASPLFGLDSQTFAETLKAAKEFDLKANQSTDQSTDAPDQPEATTSDSIPSEEVSHPYMVRDEPTDEQTDTEETLAESSIESIQAKSWDESPEESTLESAGSETDSTPAVGSTSTPDWSSEDNKIPMSESIGQWSPERAFEPTEPADSTELESPPTFESAPEQTTYEASAELETNEPEFQPTGETETASSFEAKPIQDVIANEVESADANLNALQSLLGNELNEVDTAAELTESTINEGLGETEGESWQAEEAVATNQPAMDSTGSEEVSASGSSDSDWENQGQEQDATGGLSEDSSPVADGASLTESSDTDAATQMPPANPFAESFEQEELLRDRFAPVIAAQNLISSQLTSSDLVGVRPFDLVQTENVDEPASELDSADTADSIASSATETVSEGVEETPEVAVESIPCVASEDSTCETNLINETGEPQNESSQYGETESVAETEPVTETEPVAETEPDSVRYAVVRPASLPMAPEPESASAPAETRYHQQVTDVVNEDISRQADEILKRLQANQNQPPQIPVSHETDVNTSLPQNSQPSEVEASTAILEEIRSQQTLLQSQTGTGDESTQPPVHQDDKEMILIDRQRESEAVKKEPQKIPFPETPASTGNAERMDYQRLFDQLRNVNQENV